MRKEVAPEKCLALQILHGSRHVTTRKWADDFDLSIAHSTTRKFLFQTSQPSRVADCIMLRVIGFSDKKTSEAREVV
jgi:hypothetical protein